jgi:hypothetical protein
MSNLKIWYSVGNGGDGSAYPQWFENERLTEIDQELMMEGWGETCNGYIEVEGDNLKIISKITTTQEVIESLKYKLTSNYYKEKWSEIKEYLIELENK